MPLTVLYIHTAGIFGGASRSLLELIQAFPKNAVTSQIIMPEGNSTDFFKPVVDEVIDVKGIPQFDNTRFGFYRGLRWLILLRELFFSPFFLAALIKAKRRCPNIQVIHVNEITALIPAILAKWVFKVPVVLHARSVQAAVADTPQRSKFIKRLTRRYIEHVVAIDETVKRSLVPGINASVIHNGFAAKKNTPFFASGEKKQDKTLRVGWVGSLLELKGIFDLLEAAKICLDKELDMEFILAGENVRETGKIRSFLLSALGFSKNIRAQCEKFILDNKLSEKVRLVGFDFQIEHIYSDIDLLCFPSHLDAVGRPVFEAAFFKVPSIVAVTNPLPDTFEHGETGLAVTPKQPKDLARALEYFYEQPEELERMGLNAFDLASKNFNIQKNAAKIATIYNDLLVDN